MFKHFLLLILAGCLVMSFTNSSVTAPLTQKPAKDSSWHLVFEDTKAKIYYTDAVCDNANVLKLRIVNLGDDAFKATYKIFETGTGKDVSLFGHQELEGLCSDAYKTVLIETIPAGLTTADIKASITYLPQVQ